MHRRLLLSVGAVGVAVYALLGFALLAWFLSPAPRVSLDSFSRLQAGMSAKDVKALLGEPTFGFGFSTRMNRVWRGEGVTIHLIFDDDQLLDGEATPKQRRDWSFRLGDDIPTDETLLDGFRRWLRL